MAATYKPADAVQYARVFVKGIPVDMIDSQTCDFIQTQMWDFFPWNFTLKQQLKVGSAFLTNGTQDIGTPPTDLNKLIWARLRRTDFTDGHYYKELTVCDRLFPADPGMICSFDNMQFVAYHADINKFRLENNLYIATGTELTQLDIEYQKLPTKITETLMASVMTDIPDWYFPIFMEGILWKFMTLANDKRQGAMQISKSGAAVYTGQMGVFYNGLIARSYTERAMNAQFIAPANGSIGS